MMTRNLFGRVKAWQRTRTLRQELAGLSDRQLADIGLRREQIELVASGMLVRASARPL
jgi:uncharacterized protein YjiS (DUF1127 family)